MAKLRRGIPADPVPIKGIKIEEAMMDVLKFSGLDRHHLSELLTVVTKLGVKPVKVFPYGIPNPDGIGIDVSLDGRGLGSLLGRLGNIGRIDNIQIFPKGIPFPRVFDARIHIK